MELEYRNRFEILKTSIHYNIGLQKGRKKPIEKYYSVFDRSVVNSPGSTYTYCTV